MNLLPMSPVRWLPISPVHTKGGLGGFLSLDMEKDKSQ